MRETHHSMIAIFERVEKYEKESSKYSGAHYDPVLLARPQIEAVFIGLLITHDPARYIPLYQKASWAATVRAHYYQYLHVGDTPSGKKWLEAVTPQYLEWARQLGITPEQEQATLADLRGEVLTTQQMASRIRHLPTPGQVIQTNLLAESGFADFADLLWRQWQFLCDSAHLGMSGLLVRNLLRGDPVPMPEIPKREDILTQQIHPDSVIASLAAIMSLITVMTYKFFLANESLLVYVTDGWLKLRQGTMIGSILWDGWARRALGILKDPD